MAGSELQWRRVGHQGIAAGAGQPEIHPHPLSLAKDALMTGNVGTVFRARMRTDKLGGHSSCGACGHRYRYSKEFHLMREVAGTETVVAAGLRTRC